MGTQLENANILNFANHLDPFQAEVSEYKAKVQSLINQLNRELQSSLELQDVLTLFFNRISLLLNLDGFCYTHDEYDCHYSTTEQGRNKVSYNMETDTVKLGVLVFTRDQRFQETELESLESLLSCTVFPLRNCLKYKEALKGALTDALTQCGNRHAFETSLAREMDLAQRDGSSLSLVLLDFDHFKQINDQYGHSCGDIVLQQSIQEIQSIIRRTDMLFRFGGEEFVLVLHRTSAKAAALVADKIRRHIAATSFTYADKTIPVTLSAGVASLTPDDTRDSLLMRTDEQLYCAKHQGRNLVCFD